MTHEGRGGLHTNAADPHWHLEIAVKFSEEGGGEDTAQLCAAACVYKLGWVCMVYCSLDILLLVTLRMALNQTHQRGSKAAKFMTSE